MGEVRSLTMIDERPLPLPDDATAEFWAACKRHELRIPRCVGCRKFRWPPRPMCPECQSFDVEWVQVSGRGTIFSFVIAHPPLLPAFAAKAPMPVLLVELAEDPRLRLVGNLIEPVARERLRVGARVEVAFEDVDAEIALPQWRVID